MTQNLSGWLSHLIGPVLLKVAGVPQTPRGNVDFAGATSSHNVATDTVTITLGGPPSSLVADGTGYAQITAPVRNTSNAKVTSTEYQINVSPPGVNTAVTALTIPTATGKFYSIRGIVAFHNSSANAYGEYEINAFAGNAAGTVTLLSNTVTMKAQNAAFVVALSVSGTSILVSVTDPAGATQSRRITGSVYVAERTF